MESRRASWRKGCFKTDLKEREELGQQRGRGRIFQAEEIVLAGLEVRKLIKEVNEVQRGQQEESERREGGLGRAVRACG